MLATIAECPNNEIKIWKLFKYFETKFMRPHIKIGTYDFSAHQACFYLHHNYIALKRTRPLDLFIETIANR